MYAQFYTYLYVRVLFLGMPLSFIGDVLYFALIIAVLYHAYYCIVCVYIYLCIM